MSLFVLFALFILLSFIYSSFVCLWKIHSVLTMTVCSDRSLSALFFSHLSPYLSLFCVPHVPLSISLSLFFSLPLSILCSLYLFFCRSVYFSLCLSFYLYPLFLSPPLSPVSSFLVEKGGSRAFGVSLGRES